MLRLGLRDSATLELVPTNNVASTDAQTSTWAITGADPNFLLRSRFSLSPGIYELRTVGGAELDRIEDVSLYIDSGEGFDERQRAYLRFRSRADEFVTRFTLTKPARLFRLDPGESPSDIQFSLKALHFQRIGDVRRPQRKAGPKQYSAVPQHKILINLFRLLPDSRGAGGAGRLARAFLTYLPEIADVRAIISFHHDALRYSYPDIEFVVVQADDFNALAPHLSWCDCYFDPLNGLRPLYIPESVAVLGMVLDLQHIEHPAFFSPHEIDARHREYGYVIKRSDAMVAISEYEKKQLEKYYGYTDVTVMHLSGFLAEEQGDTARRDEGSLGDHFVYPAVPWHHKNHETLLEAAAILKERGIDICIVMTNVGSHPTNALRLEQLAVKLGVDDRIVFENFIEEWELLDLLVNGRGMLFPSIYEGFGIPLVDAMKLGVPILASKSTAIPELCGEACRYFANHRNSLAVAADIAGFLNDTEARSRLSEAGRERGEKFSARTMAKVLAEAAGKAIANAKQASQSSTRDRPRLRLPDTCDLSVCVLYTADDAPLITSAFNEPGFDLDAHHAKFFGDNAHVTVCLDLHLIARVNAAVFENSDRLIVFAGSDILSRDLAVQSFSSRYFEGRYMLVTTASRCCQYTPASLRSAVMALDLSGSAQYATFDPAAPDVVPEPAPSEVDGVLGYEMRRRQGCTVLDTLLRRGQIPELLANGTPEFLATLMTKCAGIRVPTEARLGQS